MVEPEAKAEPISREELHERKILLIVGMNVRTVAFWKTYDVKEVYKSFLEDYIPNWASQHRVLHLAILHDDARPHKAMIIRELIDNNCWVNLAYLPCSPDMNPSQVGFAESNNTADNRANIGGTIIGAPIVGQ